MSDQTRDVQAIIQRIETLERQNRWLKGLGLAASLSVLAIMTMGQARPSRTVEAERFVLRDAHGRMRGRLAAEEGGPALDLYDSNGAPKLSMGVAARLYGPFLYMSNVNTNVNSKPRAAMYLTEGGAVNVELVDETGYSAVLGTSQVSTRRTGDVQTTSAASLKLFDKDGKVIWSAP